MKKALMTTILAAVLSLLATILPSPANAGTTTTLTTDLVTTSLQATERGGLEPIMRLAARHYDVGERVLVTSRLGGKSTVDKYPRMALRVDATGAATVRGPVVSQNHYGKDAGVEYLTVRWLFVAPVAGTYTITARAEATSYYKTAETQLLIDPATTYLKTSATSTRSVGMGPANDSCVGHTNHPSPDYAPCADPRTSKDVNVKTVKTYGLDKMSVTSDLELSREYGSYPGGSGKVKVTLYVRGVNSSGKTCVGTVTSSKTLSISSLRHHYHDARTVSLDTSCAVKVLMRTRVTHISGNSVAIHDDVQSNGAALLS
jgi:hypothetical protein